MSNKNGIIYFDGVGKNKGGLCDRLKGMYSSWILSEKLNKEFIYNIPFPVVLKAKNYKQINTDNFTELNIIDWDNYLSHLDKIKKLDFSDLNYKIHTNIDFSNNFNLYNNFYIFMDTFFNLKEFEKEHNVQKYDIGIHVRCGGEMVKWNDYDFGKKLIESVFKKRLECLCDCDKEIFLCSDSQKLLDMVDSYNIKNIYLSPYEPNHIDRGFDVSENDYISTFYDLLTLANCQSIYATLGEFAKTSSRIYNNELQYF
jgi:hypothetical protein